ncbi:hypothetical protein CKQ84_22245 [Shewanella sp. WE21]|uniref:ATP-dependent DNA ligase n=1 Tax=Shewanella sp. WE21 TaxID=2029986 RepID=UPI000CF6ADE3|nr:ATP-dependent DNA ligase [Shewanella sp. WE21]AVI68336.1 hypothetical protein CKQ84_22245 [Shewanella sp. WE21]
MKPLLAATADVEKIDFDKGVLCSPKLDGIRCLGINGVAMSRSMKPIPNQHVQALFATGLLDGLDGELIVGSVTAPDVFRKSSSAIMTKEGEPKFTFYVFDSFDIAADFNERYARLLPRVYQLNESGIPNVMQVVHEPVRNIEALEAYEAAMLAQGYEGVMIRSATGQYKQGRSTISEGILLKLKRFADDEFEIIGFEERTNSSGIGYSDLGALILKHQNGQFNCGTGFSAKERQQIWNDKAQYLGKIAKVKHFESGAKDLPRFPVWLGLRDPLDMDNSQAESKTVDFSTPVTNRKPQINKAEAHAYWGLNTNQIDIIKTHKARCMSELAEDIRYLSSNIDNAIGHFMALSFSQQRIACFQAGIDSEPYTETDFDGERAYRFIEPIAMTQDEKEQLATAVVELELISLSAKLTHYIESMAARMRLEFVAA